MRERMTAKIAFVFGILLFLCHGISAKILTFEAHSGKFIAFDSAKTEHKHEFSMETLTNGEFPATYKTVSTVIMYGENVTTTVEPSLAHHVAAIFEQIRATELIVVEIVPDIYLAGLPHIASRIKYLSLYSYLGDLFKRPCDVFPHLEELHLELMEMAGMDLSSCKRLKKLWVRGDFAPTDVDRSSVDKDRHVALMESVSHLLHAATAESLALGMWDRSSYDWEFAKTKNRMQLTAIVDSVLEPAITNQLEYVEVAPCSSHLLTRIISRVDRQSTVVRAFFDGHELVGYINMFYIYIYDMAKPPAEQLAAVPSNITYLGLRFDNASAMSAEWWGYLYQLTKIEMLVLDCRPSMLGALLKRKDKVTAFLPNLSVIAMAIHSDRVTRPRTVQGIILRAIVSLFDEVPTIENVIIQFVGFTGIDLSPVCQNMGAEHVNGRPQITFNCFNENRRSADEIDVIDIGRRTVRATDDDHKTESQFAFFADGDDHELVYDELRHADEMVKGEMVTAHPEKHATLKDAMSAAKKTNVVECAEEEGSYSFIREVVQKVRNTADVCWKFTERIFVNRNP